MEPSPGTKEELWYRIFYLMYCSIDWKTGADGSFQPVLMALFVPVKVGILVVAC